MKSPVELWGVGLAVALVLTVGLMQAGLNVGGDMHSFVGQMMHLFGTPLLP
jgi:hypothetical protein